MYKIINKRGTPFNSFYCFHEKQGVFQHKCFSIYKTKKEAKLKIEEILNRVKEEHIELTMLYSTYKDNQSFLDGLDKELKIWIDTLKNCKVIEYNLIT